MIQKEFSRVFATRRMLLVFLLFLILEGLLLVYDEKKNNSYSAEAYRAVWTELEARTKDEGTEETLTYLDTRIQTLDFLDTVTSFGMDVEDGSFGDAGDGFDYQMFLELQYPELDIREVLKQYRAGEIVLHTERPFTEKGLYQAVAAEYRNSVSYPEYREGIIADAEKMLRFPVFSKPGTFGYRNIEATLEKYSKLPEINVTATPAKSVSVLFQGSIPGILLLFFTLYLCVPLYLEEKEEGTLRITRTCPKGRRALAGTKLAVLFLGIFLMQSLLYAVRFLLLWKLYGFPELSRSIQCVSGFESCVLPVSIAGYFLRIFFFRYGMLCFCAVCMAVFCSVCSNTKSAFACILGFFAVQVLCYYAVSANASYGALHFLNLWGMLRFDPVGTYLNLNLFGRPVSCLFMMLVTAGTGLFAGAFAEQRLFCRKPVTGKRGAEKKHRFGGKTTSLLFHEGWKIFWDQKIGIILLLVLAAQLFFCFNSQKTFSIDDAYYRYYMEKLAGPLTPEKEQYIEEEKLRFEKLHSADSFDAEAQKQLNAERGFQKAYRRYLQVKTVPDGEFFYDTGYSYLFAESGYRNDLLLAVTAIAVLTLTGAGVFGTDTESGMLRLVTTAKNGKKGIRARLFWGGVLTVLVWLLVYLPDFVRTLLDYGTEGLSASAHSMTVLAEVKSLPLWGCLLLLYVVRLLSLFLLGSIVCLLSCATKSTAVTIFASLVGFGIPALLILLNERLSGVLFWVAPFSGNLLRKYPKAVSLGCIAACLAVTVVLHNLLIRKKG